MITSQTIPRRRLHRSTFVAAGIYNIAWGVYSALDPQWLFRFANMAPLNQPAIFSCLAMVVGLYGLVYFEVARRLEAGFPLAAIGLIGKILGPIGLGVLMFSGQWPVRSIVLCLTNDLIWWVPFALYLGDAWPFFRSDLRASNPRAQN
ncbi:MAG: hypothetical protein ABJB66_12860 [Gemmatimonadaceae bacterium]